MELSKGMRVLTLSLVFIAIFGLRLYFSYSTSFFSDSESYMYSYISDNFLKTGELIDSAPWDVYPIVYSKFFSVLISPFVLFSSSFVAKFVFAFINSLTVFLFYAIARSVTKSDSASLFSAALAGFVPVYVSFTTNTLTPLPLVIPLFFLCSYFFMDSQSDYSKVGYVISILFFSFLHPLSILFILVLFGYALISFVSRRQLHVHEKELILFSALLTTWCQFLLYKRVFLFHGFSSVWQNLPSELVYSAFSDVGLVNALVALGLFPFLFGVFVFTKYIGNIKHHEVMFLSSIILSSAVLQFFQVIYPEFGLSLLGISFALLSGISFKMISSQIQRSRFGNTSFLILVFFILCVSLTFIQSFNNIKFDGRIPESYSLSVWIDKNTRYDSVFIAPPSDSLMISFVGHRKTILHPPYILQSDVAERFVAIQSIYQTPFAVAAVEKASFYGANYLVVTPNSNRFFGVSFPRFLPNSCFTRKAGINNTEVYELSCKPTQTG